MKIFNEAVYATPYASPYDWDRFIAAFDWHAFYEVKPDGVDRLYDEASDFGFGVPPVSGGYRVIPLGISVSMADMAALREKCVTMGRPLWPGCRNYFKLSGDMLFIIDSSHGHCSAIVRFERTSSGMKAFEFLEDALCYAEPHPYLVSSLVAQWLSELLPQSRYEESDDPEAQGGETWQWREP